MLTDELKRRVLSLTIEERMELVLFVNRSIEESRSETEQELLTRGAMAVMDLFGVIVMARTSLADVVDARKVFCYRMRQEGMRYKVMARYLGLDHSTVMYYCGAMADALALPKAYRGLVKKYEMLNERMR